MGDYVTDRQWSDQWLPYLRRLIGPYLLTPSTLQQDTEQATDLIVLCARDMRIACRVRRPGFADRFPGQFTIRSKRANGCMTELAKILDGWGDWFFYGHDTGGQKIAPWVLLDLAVFRQQFVMGRSDDDWEYANTNIPNFDGTYFRAYSVDLFPPSFVIGTSGRPGARPASTSEPPRPAPQSTWTSVGPLPTGQRKLFP